MWELDYKESWALKNWCFLTVVLEKTLESPLDYKVIQPAHPKGDQSWVFFGRNDANAETPVLWPPHVKNWLTGKDSDAGRDWGQEEKGMTEDETAGWHNRLDGREFEWTLGDGDGQGGLACCDSWGRKESDMNEQLNWTELIPIQHARMVQVIKWIKCSLLFGGKVTDILNLQSRDKMGLTRFLLCKFKRKNIEFVYIFALERNLR